MPISGKKSRAYQEVDVLTRLEKMIDEAHAHGIYVDDNLLPESSKLDGLFLSWKEFGLNVILLNRHRSQRVVTAVMAEEIGHYYTCVGNALDQQDVTAVKLENAGRQVAYKKTLPMPKLKTALESGTCNIWELAERFDLPEPFIRDACEYYARKENGQGAGIACFWTCSA